MLKCDTLEGRPTKANISVHHQSSRKGDDRILVLGIDGAVVAVTAATLSATSCH